MGGTQVHEQAKEPTTPIGSAYYISRSGAQSQNFVGKGEKRNEETGGIGTDTTHWRNPKSQAAWIHHDASAGFALLGDESAVDFRYDE